MAGSLSAGSQRQCCIRLPVLLLLFLTHCLLMVLPCLQYLNGTWNESIAGKRFPPRLNYSEAFIKVTNRAALVGCVPPVRVCA